MQNAIVAANAVLPFLVYMLFGMFLNRSNILEESFARKMNSFIAKAFLPIVIFDNIYKNSLRDMQIGGLLIYIISMTVILLIVCCIVFTRIEKSNPVRLSMIFGTARSNTVFYGLPLSLAVLGEGNSAECTLATTAIGPVMHLAIAIVGGMYSSQREGDRIQWKTALKGAIRNKYLWAGIIAIIVNLCGIGIPKPIAQCMSAVASTVTPLIFIFLGATFRLVSARKNAPRIFTSIFVKLVIYPAVFLCLPVIWGWHGNNMMAVMVCAISPSAASSYAMLADYGGDIDLIGEIIAIGSLVSIFTSFLWLFIFKELGFL